ncbi:MAG: hypothetical protein R2705_24860 [Ilumatobacteraceae bacterium]
MDLARLVTSGLVTMEMAQSISAYPGEIQAQVSTLRAQARPSPRRRPVGRDSRCGPAGRHRDERSASTAGRRELSGRSCQCRAARNSAFKTSPGVTPCPGGWLVLPARLAGVTVAAEEAFLRG